MSISNIYPTGTNTEVINNAAFVEAASHGPGFTGLVLANIITSVELGKTFNTVSVKFPRLTATLTGNNTVEVQAFFDTRFNTHPSLAVGSIIGTAYVANITDSTYITVPVKLDPLGGGEPAGTFNFSTPVFPIANTKQYDISYILTYPHA
jgi:hypothetical protein